MSIRRFLVRLSPSANGQFTIRAAADAFRVSKVTVCYYSALIKRLPVELVTWLERTEDPRVLGFLTERRLRPITGLIGDNQILRLKSVLSTLSNELRDDDRLGLPKQRIQAHPTLRQIMQPVGSKNSAELEVGLSTAVAAGWISTFQLKIDNVWLRKPRESPPILSARSACSIL